MLSLNCHVTTLDLMSAKSLALFQLIIKVYALYWSEIKVNKYFIIHLFMNVC